jgi:hypothetical protein
VRERVTRYTPANPAAQPANEAGMDAETMRRRLGVFSSHPAYERRRVLVWFGVACAPAALAVIVVGMLLLAVGVSSTIELLLRNGNLVILYGLGSFGFALAFGMTAALVTRASRCSMLVEDTDAPGSLLQVRAGFVGVWVVFLLLGALAWIGPLLASAAPRVKSFLALLSIVPLALVVAVIFLLPTSRDNGATQPRGKRWPWWILFGLLLLMYGAVWIQSIGLWFARIRLVDEVVRLVAGVSPDLARTLDPEHLASIAWIVVALATMVLAPVGAALVVGFSLVRSAVREAESSSSAPQSILRNRMEPLLGEEVPEQTVQARRLGLDTRAALEGGVPRSDSADHQVRLAPAQAAPPPIDLCAEIKAVAEAQVVGRWDPARAAPREVSPLDGTDDALDRFFCGFQPSADQVQAFRSIHTAFDRSAGTDDPPWSRQTCDCLLTGDSGTGRSSVLAAAIVRGVVVRGHTALLLVPNELKADATVRRLKQAATACGVGSFLQISRCDDLSAREWSSTVDGGAAPRQTPDVLVATASEFEEAFFAKSSNYDRLRALLTRLQLAGVDDFDRFSGIERMHLPFLLQKLRIVLASEGLHCQTIVVARTMSASAEALVCQRLLWGAGEHAQLRLKPFERRPDESEPLHFDLQAKQPGISAVWDVVETMVRKAVGHGCPALVYAPTLSQTEATSIGSQLSGGAGCVVKVVIDLDQLEAGDAKRWRGVFHAACDGKSAAVAIRGRATGEDVLVFSVRPASAKTLELPVHDVLPLMPSGRDSGLLASHWRSLVRFLKRGVPIHRAVWMPLGLGSLRDYPDSSELARGFRRENAERALRLDESPTFNAKVWPWSALQPSYTVSPAAGSAWSPAAAPVDITKLPDAYREIARVSGDGSIEILDVRPADSASGSDGSGSLVHLRPEAALEIPVDFAFGNALRFQHGKSVYYPVSSERAMAQGAKRMDAGMWLERETAQASQPNWRIRGLGGNTPLACNARAAGALQGALCLFEVVEAQSKKRARLNAKLALGGLFNAELRTNPVKVDIDYECTAFVIGFDWGYSPNQQVEAAERVRAVIETPLHDTAWNPELGALVTAVIRRHVPGLEDFVRCVGVDVEGVEPASRCSFVLCIEPLATSGTAQSLLERALQDSALAISIRRTMQALVDETGEGARETSARLFLAAGSAFHARVNRGGAIELDLERVARLRRFCQSLVPSVCLGSSS